MGPTQGPGTRPAADADAAEAAASARLVKLLVLWVTIGFVVGAAVLVFSIRLDWV